jgi:succinate dehydrogenase subunit C
MSRKPYLRVVPRTHWFLRHPRYMRYMAREVTCIFIGIYTVLLLVGLASLAEGRTAYDAFLTSLQSPGSIVFHLTALGFAAYHSVTWFNLTPRALRVQIGEKFLPDGVIAGAHYALWALLTVAVLVAAKVV